ncbi:hypothetical protein CKO12_04755 [Chromatium okenii]|uniref:FAD-dependent oxidoreductase n=1 Tax=Chromatium okenii TaxID=61644 RepID=UPI001908B6DB|nr:FAD-dependent oxidoreductase [Chromatium okenii]MBK1641194.1 hypothetical protein [Chromatium okenii]
MSSAKTLFQREALELPTWLAAASTAAVAPLTTLAAVLPGFTAAQQLSPLQRVQRVQDAGLLDCGGSGNPLAPHWQQVGRSRAAVQLVIDATDLDPNAGATATLLAQASLLLLDGVLIAAGLRGSEQVVLWLPPALRGQEIVLLNALDALVRRFGAELPPLQITVQRQPLPNCASAEASTATQLVQRVETWCQIALLFATGAVSSCRLLTLRSGGQQPGVVALKLHVSLREQLATWGGMAAAGADAILQFDAGLGGLLPLAAADIRCEPLHFAEAGIAPAPATITVLADGGDVVQRTRQALYRHWELAETASATERGLLARAVRLTTELTLGRGELAHLRALEALTLDLTRAGLAAAAATLGSALRYFRPQWDSTVGGDNRQPTTDNFFPPPAPCHRTCPAHIDIPSFMAHLGRGEHRAAIAVIRQDNPLPLVCGLVCPAPCETACLRGSHDGAVFIRPMKARAAELCLEEGGYPHPELAPATGKRVGIIGSGPAGLAAAYYLRLQGHAVEIFEAQAEAGGMLRYGIPAYRLPAELLEQELEQIRTLGVTIHTAAKVEQLAAFRANYDAVFIALGTQKSRLIPLDGGDGPNVLGGIDFLREVRSANGAAVRVGPRVVVIGGGNVAVDVALTALRQGATHVDMVALERRQELPASHHEIEAAVAQGVQLYPSWGPLRVEADGTAVFQFCLRVKDDEGRFAPSFDAERLLRLPANQVILAVGQGTDVTLLDGSGVETVRGFIVADPLTQMTSVPGVFAGGDAHLGPRTAVEAIRSGKLAAAAMDAWLQISPTAQSQIPSTSLWGAPQRRAQVVPLPVAAARRSQSPRTVMPEKPVAAVLGEGNYVQIEEGLTAAMSLAEAQRCLRCDSCIGCGLCVAACSEMGVEALRMAATPANRLVYLDFIRPATLCIGCGACTQVCPTGAIRLEDSDGMRRTVITGTVVREQPLLTCSACGVPTQTAAQRDFIRGRLPPHLAISLARELCPSCARARAERPLASVR